MVQDPEGSFKKFQTLFQFFSDHADHDDDKSSSLVTSHDDAERSQIDLDGLNRDSATLESTRLTPISDILDTDSAEAKRANAFARALVTARMDEDLGYYIELLGDLKSELGLRTAAGNDDATYVLALVGSLSLIASVMVRTAERSGMETESGQPLLVDLFDFLTEANGQL